MQEAYDFVTKNLKKQPQEDKNTTTKTHGAQSINLEITY